MGKFTGWLIATDLDGTLIADDQKVSQKNIDAIHYFQEEGGFFTIATGRSLAMCTDYLQKVPINAPAILINGTLLYDTKLMKPVFQHGLDRKIATQMLDAINLQFPDVCAQIHCDGPIAIVSPHSCKDQFLEQADLPRRQTEAAAVPEPWYKIMFYSTAERLSVVEKYVAENVSSSLISHFDIMYSAPYYLEMMPAGTTKGSGLLHLAEILGVPASQTVGIGDYYNDADMIRMAGLGVAVANAPQAIRDLAQVVVGSNNDGAIADLITYIETMLLAPED